MGLRVVVRSRPDSAPPKGTELSAPPDASSEGAAPAFEFEQERILIGRAEGSDIRLPALAVGARHLSLRIEGARVVAIDHGSLNGTRVNGAPLVPERPRALRDGDQLEIGGYQLTLTLGAMVSQSTTRERTLSLARRLLKDELGGGLGTSRLVVLNGAGQGREHPIPAPPATLRIGRATSCEIPLDDADASREHAELSVDLDGVVVRDLGSKNGIEVNHKKVTERRLRDRDELLVGATVLVFEDPTEQKLAARATEAEVALPPIAAHWTETKDETKEEEEEAPPKLEAPRSARSEPTEPVLSPPRVAPTPWLAGPELVVLLVALAVVVASIAGLVFLLGE